MASRQLSLSVLTWIRFVQLGWIQIWGAGDQVQSERSQRSCGKCRHLLLAESRSLTCRHCSWWCWDRPAERRSSIKWRKVFLISLGKKKRKRKQREGTWEIVRRHRTVKKEKLRNWQYRRWYEWVTKWWKKNQESCYGSKLSQVNSPYRCKPDQVRDNWGGLRKGSPKVTDE